MANLRNVTHDPASPPPSTGSTRRYLHAAAALLGVEGLILSVLAVGLVVHSASRQPEDRTGLLLQAALLLAVGVLLALGTRPLLGLRGWVRSPLVVAQLLALPVGAGLVQAHVWWAAVPVLGFPLGVLTLLATREARQPFLDAA